jgi:hypothetical protein
MLQICRSVCRPEFDWVPWQPAFSHGSKRFVVKTWVTSARKVKSGLCTKSVIFFQKNRHSYIRSWESPISAFKGALLPKQERSKSGFKTMNLKMVVISCAVAPGMGMADLSICFRFTILKTFPQETALEKWTNNIPCLPFVPLSLLAEEYSRCKFFRINDMVLRCTCSCLPRGCVGSVSQKAKI